MNALYVTVSIIPLILVFAGFNHAHGLTTFGKTNNPPNENKPPTATGKPCTTQANCNYVRGTTCLKSYCLCGDNSHPVNGVCSAQFKGPKHICQKDEECVDGALCLEQKDIKKTNNAPATNNNNNSNNSNPILICQCTEGLSPTPGGQCNGGSPHVVFPGLLVILISLLKFY